MNTIPGLEVKTTFAALRREHPERFADAQLRTLQRKVKHWRAIKGPAQEMYFVQEHRVEELCESDFTHLRTRKLLALTQTGKTFGVQMVPIAEEMELLRALSERRFDSAGRASQFRKSAQPWSGTASVNSRLIGDLVEARIFESPGGLIPRQKLEQLPRLCVRTTYRVDHRHIIDWLVPKRGVFAS